KKKNPFFTQSKFISPNFKPKLPFPFRSKTLSFEFTFLSFPYSCPSVQMPTIDHSENIRKSEKVPLVASSNDFPSPNIQTSNNQPQSTSGKRSSFRGKLKRFSQFISSNFLCCIQPDNYESPPPNRSKPPSNRTSTLVRRSRAASLFAAADADSEPQPPTDSFTSSNQGPDSFLDAEQATLLKTFEKESNKSSTETEVPKNSLVPSSGTIEIPLNSNNNSSSNSSSAEKSDNLLDNPDPTTFIPPPSPLPVNFDPLFDIIHSAPQPIEKDPYSLSIGSAKFASVNGSVPRLDLDVGAPFQKQETEILNAGPDSFYINTLENSNILNSVPPPTEFGDSLPILNPDSEENDEELRSEIASPTNNIASDSTERLVHHVSNHFLLEPVLSQHYGRKCLVLDLDETLVHSSFRVRNLFFFIPSTIPIHSFYFS
ncbi:hypothetical protein AYI68_g7394, partial [Smittium mucronatum]